MNSRRVLASAAAVFAVALVVRTDARQLHDTFANWLDHPAIDYTSAPTSDAVAELNRRLVDGSATLTFDGASGYLRSVLAALDVPVESQIAVFAKDSAQQARINMHNPRTLFFNDTVSVGWVRGGFIELVAQDPRQGMIFYVLDQAPGGRPRFARRDDCLTCHHSYSTAGVPGVLVRSAGEFAVNHTLPIDRRWGGWYVTGRQVPAQHRGNVDFDRLFEAPVTRAPNWPSFSAQFDTSGYLSSYSDVAALMVFEHQMHLMNLLTRIGWEARVQQPTMPLADAAREVVDYMLFVDEAPLEDTIAGSSGFVERFEAMGPRDKMGRSLRQVDLRTRLMRHPCSYMVYAPVFDALPGRAKEAIYQRLWQVLSGTLRDAAYKNLSRTDRQAIVEILRDTKPDLPAYFRS